MTITLPALLLNMASVVYAIVVWLLYVQPRVREGDTLNRLAWKTGLKVKDQIDLETALYSTRSDHYRDLFVIKAGQRTIHIRGWWAEMVVMTYGLVAWTWASALLWPIASCMAASSVTGLLAYLYRYRAMLRAVANHSLR